MSLNTDDLVFCKGPEGITAGGYTINSALMGGNSAPIATMNGGKAGGSVSSVFKDLAVPAGLLYMQRSIAARHKHEKTNDMIPDGLYDKLFSLAEEEEKKKPRKKRDTRRKRASKTSARKSKKSRK
jgi:hypothetical protein